MSYNRSTDPNFNPLARAALQARRAREEATGLRVVGTTYGAVAVPEEIAHDRWAVDAYAKETQELEKILGNPQAPYVHRYRAKKELDQRKRNLRRIL